MKLEELTEELNDRQIRVLACVKYDQSEPSITLVSSCDNNAAEHKLDVFWSSQSLDDFHKLFDQSHNKICLFNGRYSVENGFEMPVLFDPFVEACIPPLVADR